LTFALIFISLGALLISQDHPSGRLKIIACNVGQGDGMLIVSPNGKQIVVDGGSGSKISDCLGQKIPFSDRTIELMVLSHPQRDHMEGLVDVLARYEVETVVTSGIESDSALFKVWKEALDAEGAEIYKPIAGDKIEVDGMVLDFLWPTLSKYAVWETDTPLDLNDTSVVFRLNYGNICGYFTGDLDKIFLETIVDQSCQILKVSHHGSNTGTNQKIIDLAGTKLAIIQVGRNSYGHPHKEVIDLLLSNGATILRNDTEGIIEIESDGRDWQVKS